MGWEREFELVQLHRQHNRRSGWNGLNRDLAKQRGSQRESVEWWPESEGLAFRRDCANSAEMAPDELWVKRGAPRPAPTAQQDGPSDGRVGVRSAR